MQPTKEITLAKTKPLKAFVWKGFVWKGFVFLAVALGQGSLQNPPCLISNVCAVTISDFYHFSDPHQREAFESLCQKSGVLSAENGFEAKPSRGQFVKKLLAFVTETQKKFVVRTDGQERWHVAPLAWMTRNPEESKALLKTLGFLDTVLPKKFNPDAVCILGATHKTMENRLAYVATLIQAGRLKTQNLILLGGERYVTQGVDGTLQELEELAQKCGKHNWEQLTEMDLLKNVYDRSALSKNPALKVHVIDTPQSVTPDGQRLRPTTQSTIVALSTWQKQSPSLKKIMFVSNQPYVHYQEAVIRLALKEQKSPIQAEIIGEGFENTQGQTIGLLMGALGSYLWAALPLFLHGKERAQLLSWKDKERLKTLYGRQPMFYNAFPRDWRSCERQRNK